MLPRSLILSPSLVRRIPPNPAPGQATGSSPASVPDAHSANHSPKLERAPLGALSSLVEAAGVEPASVGALPLALHA